MGYGTESSLFGIVAAVLGIVLILTVVLQNVEKSTTGSRLEVVTGMKKRGHHWWWWTCNSGI